MPKKNKHNTIIDAKNNLKMFELFLFELAKPTLLISVRDSFISLIAFDPKFVTDKIPRPIMKRNTTPRTLYRKGNF
jgi:hypothetical protein